MRFTFTIKTRRCAVTTIEVEALDQAAAEEKVKRENPTCTITKVVTRQADVPALALGACADAGLDAEQPRVEEGLIASVSGMYFDVAPRPPTGASWHLSSASA